MSDKTSLFSDSRCGARRLFVGLVLTATLGGAKAAFAVGLDPVPNLFLDDTHIQAQVQRQITDCPFQNFEEYTYTYSITNPGPTGEIWYFKVDITSAVRHSTTLATIRSPGAQPRLPLVNIWRSCNRCFSHPG